MAVTVHELARSARLIRLRVEWGTEWGILEVYQRWITDQVRWHGDQLELTPVLVPGGRRYYFTVPLTHHYELEGNLRYRGLKIFSLYLSKGDRNFYEFDPGRGGSWG